MKYYEQLVFNSYGDIAKCSGRSHSGPFRGYYGIQYNHSGKFYFYRDKEPEVVTEGSYAFLTYPGRDFTYGAPEGETRHHCYVCFSGSLVKRFIAGGLLDLSRKNPLIQVVHSERFYSVMHNLVQLIEQPGGERNPRAAWMLEDLLLQLTEQPGASVRINPYCEHELQQLKNRIVRQPLLNWDFEEEAGKLSISYSHFRRLFREVSGCAPNQFLIEARLNHAAHLIESNDLPISEIAHLCGFEDEFYFSRIFRKHRMIPPSALRSSKR